MRSYFWPLNRLVARQFGPDIVRVILDHGLMTLMRQIGKLLSCVRQFVIMKGTSIIVKQACCFLSPFIPRQLADDDWLAPSLLV